MSFTFSKERRDAEKTASLKKRTIGRVMSYIEARAKHSPRKKKLGKKLSYAEKQILHEFDHGKKTLIYDSAGTHANGRHSVARETVQPRYQAPSDRFGTYRPSTNEPLEYLYSQRLRY